MFDNQTYILMISSYHHYYFIFRIHVEAVGDMMVVLMDKEEETQLIEVEVDVIMSQVDQV